MKGSGTIEEHADTVLLNHWEYFYTNENMNTFSLIVAKQRNGPTGQIELTYLPEFYAFEDKAGQDVQRIKGIFDAKEVQDAKTKRRSLDYKK